MLGQPGFQAPAAYTAAAGSPGGGVQRTWLCCRMNCSVSLQGSQLFQIPLPALPPPPAATWGWEREEDALIPDPSLSASFPPLKVHVSRWSQK